jgi:hypothetical protein
MADMNSTNKEERLKAVDETTDKSKNVLLTLPKTKKIIEERGYTGIKKHLYVGFAEVRKFLLMPAKQFAAIHDNFDTSQYEKIVTRTKILKTVVFSLAIATSILAAVLLPLATPVVIKFLSVILTAAFSSALFGVLVHALNNFIVEAQMRYLVKPSAFPLFTNDELAEKLLEAFNNSKNIDLDKEIAFLTENKQSIVSLFRNPNIYWSGQFAKDRMQKLIENYYFIAIETKNREAQRTLVYFIYDFYHTIDSLALQEAMLFSIETYGRSLEDEKEYETLKFFYTLNNVIFEEQYGFEDVARRISNQNKLLKFFFSGDKFRIEEEYEKPASDIGKQIFLNSYIETVSSVPRVYLKQVLTEAQFEKLVSLEKNSFDIQYFISDLKEMDIPKEIGYLYVLATENINLLRSIFLNVRLPLEYRLYALHRLSVREDNPYSIKHRINKFYSRVEEQNLERDSETLMGENIKLALVSAISESGVLDNKDDFSTGYNYLDSLEAEMLFTAAAVSLHEKYPNVNLIEFLKQLKYTFVSDGNAEFIVRYIGNGEAEYFRIAMGSNKKYVASIKDFVESIYKKNTGDETDGQIWRFKPIAKGHLALIKIVKR